MYPKKCYLNETAEKRKRNWERRQLTGKESRRLDVTASSSRAGREEGSAESGFRAGGGDGAGPGGQKEWTNPVLTGAGS